MLRELLLAGLIAPGSIALTTTAAKAQHASNPTPQSIPGTIPQSTPGTIPQSTPNTSPQYTNEQQNYFEATAQALDILNLPQQAAAVRSDAQAQPGVLDIGYSACRAFDRGFTPDTLYKGAVDRGASYDVSAQIFASAAAAAVTLCPEYSWLIEQGASRSESVQH